MSQNQRSSGMSCQYNANDEMDIFATLPEEIMDKILKYLGPLEVLNFSLVSKFWYNSIGKSNQWMKQIQLAYRYDNCKDITPIVNSSRVYQHVRFVTVFQTSKVVPKNIRNMRMIIKKFSASLITIYTTYDLQRILELPKLKELTFSAYGETNKRRSGLFRIASGGLLSKANSLEKLTIKCDSIDNFSTKFLIQRLKKLDNLKYLETNQCSFMKNWNSQEYKFQLEKFNWLSYMWSNEKVIVSEFIKSFSQTLKEISFTSANPRHAISLLTDFPKLQTLELPHFENSLNDYHEFPYNQTIETFKCGGYYRCTNIVSKLQNLKKLEINFMHEELLDFILESRSIRVVKYNSMVRITEAKRLLMTQHASINFISQSNNPPF